MWKDLYDKYEISDEGLVRNKQRGRLLKPYVRHNGGLGIGLTVEGNFRLFQLHRLVAEVFLPNPDPESKKYVKHIDGDKKNNRADNLKWVGEGELCRGGRRDFSLPKAKDAEERKPATAFEVMRNVLGMTQIELSEVLKCKKEKLSGVESGKRKFEFDFIKKYSSFVGVKPCLLASFIDLCERLEDVLGKENLRKEMLVCLLEVFEERFGELSECNYGEA